MQDANEALLKGFDLNAILSNAKPVPHDQIATFEDLREEVFREVLEPQTLSGTAYEWLPSLQNILKVCGWPLRRCGLWYTVVVPSSPRWHSLYGRNLCAAGSSTR